MTYYTDPLVTLLHGDCIEVMATLPADSVDAVVTDPPYGLEFMGKEWDRLGSIGKTSHAGVEASSGSRDRSYSAAFGRLGKVAHNGSANKKCRRCNRWAWDHEGRKCECEVPDFPNVEAHQARLMQAWHEAWGVEALRVTKPGGYLLSFGGTRTHHRLVCALEDAGWIIRDELDWIYASGFPKGKANLKPAHEPIVLARKPGPLRPLAIDECRIGTTVETWPVSRGPNTRNAMAGGIMADSDTGDAPAGRWPSNVLLSDPDLFDEPNPYVVGSGATTYGFGTQRDLQDHPGAVHGIYGRGMGAFEAGVREGFNDSGGYSRFFIVPKADRAERERGLATAPKVEGQAALQHGGKLERWPDGHLEPRKTPLPVRANVHPTVKPIDLMRHLVRLVTPSGGTVLDPFLGSGTTCLAASELGVRSIGIEREADYLAIAKDRLMATPMGLGLDDPLVGPPQPTRDGIAVQRNKTGEGYAASSYEIRQGPGPDMGYGVRRTVIDEPKAPGLFDDG